MMIDWAVDLVSDSWLVSNAGRRAMVVDNLNVREHLRRQLFANISFTARMNGNGRVVIALFGIK